MTTTPQELVGNDHGKLQEAARRHPWMHITRMSAYTDHDVAVIVRGEGAYDTTAVAAVISTAWPVYCPRLTAR